jgi:hypothetical protein
MVNDAVNDAVFFGAEEARTTSHQSAKTRRNTGPDPNQAGFTA